MEYYTKVLCFRCGGEEFRITLVGPREETFDEDGIIIECIACRDRWYLGRVENWQRAAIGEGHGQDAGGDEAVGEAGDVAADVVSAAKRKGHQKGRVMTDIGTIRMRSPAGRSSAITVSRRDDGSVDLHFSRTSEGEALMRLPTFAAKRLGDLLLQATVTSGRGDGRRAGA